MNSPQTTRIQSLTRADDTTAGGRRVRQLRGAGLLPKLRSRHWKVLELLAREPLLATGHVEALAFTEGTPLSRARTCRRALRELAEWRLVHRARPAPGGAGGGSAPATFALTSAGERLLALRDGREPARRRRPQDRGEATTHHLLGVADLHVRLSRSARERGLMARWHSEPACWLRFRSATGPELLKPDGLAEVTLDQEVRLAWVELDRGSQSVPVTIQAKVRRYCRAAVALAARKEPVPLVLFVVERESRRERIQSLLATWAAREGISASATRRLFRTCAPGAFADLLLVGGET